LLRNEAKKPPTAAQQTEANFIPDMHQEYFGVLDSITLTSDTDSKG
jgi:hypothetical protein